ncbi:DUF262 domain-containing protein [Lachnospiraceae bacterium 47-T17]|uniref:DUF262 domain-containing protein n=1 Tax=Candidatus Merdisoma sp. JLR.KK011 TaxID=3114299 RepID=UPI002FF13903
MKCESTDLEIETIVNRIKNEDMDLQPDFQRGEIWTLQKKQKLIDSILRGWKIPPIHVIHNNQSIDEVLDGQQRLAAIRDFYDNIICIDGKILPENSELIQLDGMHYRDLPKKWQRQFRQYSIVIIRLTEYQPEEPAELFYRLNQPTALTSAEQRNAYIGVTRDQVKELSNKFVALGASKETIGFSNSRLAYDEIISKFCFSVETGTLKKKITSNDISIQYRQAIPFSDECIRIVAKTLEKFMECIIGWDDFKYSFNKATIFSWFVFIRRNLSLSDTELKNVIGYFEFCRAFIKGKYKKVDQRYIEVFSSLQKRNSFFEIMLNTFNQRSSMGSTDALSIIYRDIIITVFRDMLWGNETELIQYTINTFKELENLNYTLEKIVEKYNWGEKF